MSRRLTSTVTAMAMMAMMSACVPDEGGVDVAERSLGCDWTQVFGNATHTGMPCAELRNMQVVDVIEQDADAEEKNEVIGFLQQHESSVLTLADWVVIPTTSGMRSVFDRSQDRFQVRASKWVPHVLEPSAVRTERWEFESDWQPVNAIGSFGYVTNGYVQQFGPVIANGSVYVPSRSGRLTRLSLTTGAVQAVINPFAGTPFDGDARLMVNNALTAAADGRVYFDVVAWPLGVAGPALRSVQARGTWIVEVRPDDTFRLVDFDALALAAGLPGQASPCEYPFLFSEAGFPDEGPDSNPPIFGCGRQRPALNAPISIDPATGHLVIFSYANNAQGDAYITTIDPATMTPVSVSDTKGHLMYGCGIRLTIDPELNDCDLITANGTVNIGHDPNFNRPVRYRGLDLMDSAPSIAPNGDRCIGSYDGGFIGGGEYDARGGGVCFHRDGTFASKNERHYWEVTASVWEHDGTFSYLKDEQLYSQRDLRIAQNGPAQEPEASHTAPLPDDPITLFEWLDAHIVFGAGGDRYAVNANGHLYKFQHGIEGPVESVPLINPRTGAVCAMSTLSNYAARDRKGRIYLSMCGFVWIIDSSPFAVTSSALRSHPLTDAQKTALARGRRLKAESAQSTPPVDPPHDAVIGGYEGKVIPAAEPM